MTTFAIVPVKRFENSKSRLSALLDQSDRIRLSALMVERTVGVLQRSNEISRIVVVTSEPSIVEQYRTDGVVILKESSDKGVNNAVALADDYCKAHEARASLVIPVDLPLLEPGDVDALIGYGKKIANGIVITPSLRQDGTNALLRIPPDVLATEYDNDSFNNHVQSSKNAGLDVVVANLHGVMEDLDNEEDVDRVLDNFAQTNTVAAFLKARLSLISR